MIYVLCWTQIVSLHHLNLFNAVLGLCINELYFCVVLCIDNKAGSTSDCWNKYILYIPVCVWYR